jgi:hypothetical protein
MQGCDRPKRIVEELKANPQSITRVALIDCMASEGRMGIFRTTVLLSSMSWLGAGAAIAEKRVALVVRNLAMLRNAGFDSVMTKRDLGVVEAGTSRRDFGAQTHDADVAVIFYAGRGIEMDSNNYLVPTDATLETVSKFLTKLFPLDRALSTIEPAKQFRLIILNACRYNPFDKEMKRTIAARAIGRGLAEVEPNRPNTMVAFAAKAGSTALDGDSGSIPCALALVEYLRKPGLDLRKAFGFVRDDVLKNTGYRQEPYVHSSLGRDDVPLVPTKPIVARRPPNLEDAVRRDFNLARATDGTLSSGDIQRASMPIWREANQADLCGQ